MRAASRSGLTLFAVLTSCKRQAIDTIVKFRRAAMRVASQFRCPDPFCFGVEARAVRELPRLLGQKAKSHRHYQSTLAPVQHLTTTLSKPIKGEPFDGGRAPFAEADDEDGLCLLWRSLPADEKLLNLVCVTKSLYLHLSA